MSDRPGGSGGPIEDEEDLLSEIDAWGDTFDALHDAEADEEPATGIREATPPAATAQVAVPTAFAAAVAEAPSPPDDPLLAERAPVGRGVLHDDPMIATVPAIAVAAPPPAAAPVSAGAEVDFSDLGVDGSPEALGSLLGTPLPLPPLEDEAPPADAPPPRPSHRKIPLPVNLTGVPSAPEEDEVFTSASRPSMAALPQGPTDEELFGDLADAAIPEPVAPVIAVGPAGPEATRIVAVDAALLANAAGERAPRTSGPALVRRDNLGKPRPAAGFGAESTRVADHDELAALAGGEDAGGADSPFGGGDFGGAQSTRVAAPGEVERHGRQARRSNPPPNQPVRTSPAVANRRAPGATDFGGDDDVGFDAPEATKIADLHEMEKLAMENRAARAEEDAAAKAKALFAEQAPAIELSVDEDFYADFEIGDQASTAVPAAAAAGDDSVPVQQTPAASRRTAHLVRRPMAPIAEGGVVVEIEAESSADYAIQVSRREESREVPRGDEAAVPATVAAESDFSDVAAAVGNRGVSGEIGVAEPPKRAPSIEDALDALGAEDDFSDVAAAVAPPRAPITRAPTADSMAAALTSAAEAADAAEPSPDPVPVPDPALALDADADDATLERARVTVEPEPEPVVAAPPEPDVAPELPVAVFSGVEPELELDALTLPESVDPATGRDPAEEAAHAILVYERELETVDDSAVAAALRCEAARLYERLGDSDRAHFHFEAALLADPRSFTALRGLRRLARNAGDLDGATRYLDAEIDIAGALERRALALHRVDLLMAAGDQDLARVAVGELLDEARGDVRALLAQLELAFLDGRVDELGESLGRLASALADDELRATLSVAHGHLHERAGGDPAKALAAFDAALEGRADVLSETGPALLGARRAGVPAVTVTATAALAELAGATGDATAAAGLMLRTAALATGAGNPAAATAALERARALAGRDPLVAEATLAAASDDAARIEALEILGEVAITPAARAWALSREATLRQRRGADGDLDAAALALARAAGADPTHDHITAAHEAVLAGRGDWTAVAGMAVARVGADPGAERDRVTAARALAAAGAIEQAVSILEEGRVLAPGSATLADVLADALAVAGRWSDRVTLWTSVAALDAEQIDPELAVLRAAAAAEESVAAVSEPPSSEPDAPPVDTAAASDLVGRAITSALEAWAKVLDFDGESHRAHTASIALARRLGDRDVLADALARAQAARTGATAVSLGLERARAVLAGAEPDLVRADEILGELAADDPRRLAAAMVVAARSGRWSDVAMVLEERAAAAVEAGATLEAVTLRYRAAQILLDRGDDLVRAAGLLGQVLEDRPQLTAAADALSAARRRLGDSGSVASPLSVRATAAELGSGSDAFARLVREAELVAYQGDAHAAIGLLQRALELRPGDPLAAAPLLRTARAAGEPGPVTSLALVELKHADDLGDAGARADAYEVLARVDAELRGDAGSALLAWESAATADPTRHAVLRQLERAYVATGRLGDLYTLRGRQLEALGTARTGDDAADLVALGLDRASLAEREGLSDDELRAAYQDVVARDRTQRLALFHLESLVRRAGTSDELAGLEEAIADLFADDPRARAAFLTRSGETLVELGQLEAAIERFRAADALVPGWIPALQGWRLAAMRGGLWLDVADAAAREAAASGDDAVGAGLYHLAGVALMDRALVGERAMPLLRKCLAADPRHHDAFVRLRILCEEQGEHEDLARLLEERLAHEDGAPAKIALHRALAEQYRNFLGDRESAKYNYRAILELEPNDLRAVASLSDICWEQGAWAEAAEALVTRARLERDPRMLRGLFYRLGTIYADRIPQPELAIAAFQRVLATDPEDHDALERLADLGIAAGEWKMALGACERLVKSETDPERKVAHLHRVGRIFHEGFGDRAKAERAYRMALDSAPTSDAALTRLVEFYQNAGDLRSVRVHLDRIAGVMRSRLDHDPTDGVAARVIARTMAARQGAGVVGSMEVARAAAELALFLGGGEDNEQHLAAQIAPGELRGLVRPEADDLLFGRAAPGELRQIFALLGDRLSKHVGVDLRPYGVTRGDRVRAVDSPVAAAAQDVATQLGLGEIDVYVSQRQPLVMQAEPTSPVSLVLGAQLARPDQLTAVRFAAGAALKLAQVQLALVARLPDGELAALVIALLRLFQPEFQYLAADQEQVAAQQQKLRRLIPSSLLNELRPYAQAINPAGFDHHALQRAVLVGGLRAGVRASGSLGVALQVLASQRGLADLPAILRDPVLYEVISFAIGEDHARLVQLPVE